MATILDPLKPKKKKKKLSALTKLKKTLDWYESFATHIYYVKPKLYNEACEAADKQENN